MRAATIAEYFVENDGVRLELEIGLADLEAFRNLIPDEIYEGLGNPPVPLEERLEIFFSSDLVVAGDDKRPIEGRLVSLQPRKRVKRDEISGEPLASTDEDEEELVVFARLEYPLAPKTETLNLFGPRMTPLPSIGFVAYHRGIPVNDFRYLGPVQTLELDLDDPWYSHFRARSLRRTYFSPMSGFIYVEPYEVRKEIIARPRDLQGWVDLGLEGRDTIPVEMQGDLKRVAAEFLRQHHTVEIDGVSIEPELARINFLERSLRTSRVIDPPVELDVEAAILGVIFVYPTDGLPQKVTLDWDLWSDRIQRVPAASVDQAGPLPVILEPDYRVLEWQNFLKNPELPTLTVLAAPPPAWLRWMVGVRWLLLGGLTLAAVHWARAPRRMQRGGWAALALVATVAGFQAGRIGSISDERARMVVSGLLHNIYLAFDFRKEEKIYDVLEQSVDGDLLRGLYLETRRGLELANQGGARAKVKEVELVDLDAEAVDGGGFRATARWNVGGSVGHWGHVHRRANQYRAELRVDPVDGVWKITELEILEQERL